MDTVYQAAMSVVRVLRSRLFSAALLAVISAVIVAFVSLNMNAITVVDGDTSRVVLTLNDDSNKALSGNSGSEELAADSSQLSDDANQLDVQITADGITTMISMSGGTVSDALAKVGVKVGQFDLTNYSSTQAVTDDMSILVDRVAYEEYTETETIAYSSAKKYTNSIAKGKSQLEQEGQNGVKTLTYRKCYRNGSLVGTELVKEEVTVEPVEQITLVGTSTALPLSEAPYEVYLDSKGQPLEYSTVYTGRATAYSSEGGRAGKSTASGRKAQVGVVAVNPNIIPYGTELYIVSPDGSYVYGYAIAGDTGSACMGGYALTDLYFDTYAECCYFGARVMNVYVIG